MTEKQELILGHAGGNSAAKTMPKTPFVARQLGKLYNLARRATTVSKWANYAKIFDKSSYQGFVDWSNVAKVADAAILKCSEGTNHVDSTFVGDVQKAYDVHFPVAAYHFFRAQYYVDYGYDGSKWPKPDDDKQLQNVINAIKNKALWGFALDVEDLTIAPKWVANAAGLFMGRVANWCAKNCSPDFKLMVYTYPGFWEQAKAEFSWTVKYNLWLAQWPLGAGSVPATWTNFPYPSDAVKVQTLANPKWDIWQWSGDRYQLPYVYADANKKPTNLDLNFFNGTRADFYKWINKTDPGAVVTPPVDPPVENPGDDPDPATTVARITALENANTALAGRIAALEAKMELHKL